MWVQCLILYVLLLGTAWLSQAYPIEEIVDGDFLVRTRREALIPDADADSGAFVFFIPGRRPRRPYGYKKSKKFYNAKNLGAFG